MTAKIWYSSGKLHTKIYTYCMLCNTHQIERFSFFLYGIRRKGKERGTASSNAHHAVLSCIFTLKYDILDE